MGEGLQLLVVGVGVVYLFLGLLVVVLRLLARLAGRPVGADTSDGDRQRARVAAAIAVAATRRHPPHGGEER